MRSAFVMRIMRCVVLLFLQVLIINQIHLGGYATPLIVGYMVVRFQFAYSRIGILFWGFITGMMYDIFSDTMGVGMASMTFLAMVQPVLLRLFKPRDVANDFIPSIKSMGMGLFASYLITAMLVFHASFYLLEAFTLANWTLTLTAIVGGSLFSSVVIFFVDIMLSSVKRDN